MLTRILTCLFDGQWRLCDVDVGRNCQLIIKLSDIRKTVKFITGPFPLSGTIKNFWNLNPGVCLVFLRADSSHRCKPEDIILHLCNLNLMRLSAISVSTRLWLTSAAALYLLPLMAEGRSQTSCRKSPDRFDTRAFEMNEMGAHVGTVWGSGEKLKWLLIANILCVCFIWDNKMF